MSTPTTQQRERLGQLAWQTFCLKEVADSANRHGFDQKIPGTRDTAEADLEFRLGRIFKIAKEMVEAGDLDADAIERSANE